VGRSNKEFVNGTYINDPGNNGFTLFHGAGQNAIGTQSGSLVKIEGPSGSYRDYKDLSRRAEYYGNDVTNDDTAFPAVRDENGDVVYENDSEGWRRPVRQGVLFNDTRKPPKLDLMAATKDVDHTVPALLETANNESQKRWGQDIEHSDNLSMHSLPLVNRLIRAGIAKGPEIKEVGNPYDWHQAHDIIQNALNEKTRYWDESDTTQVDPEEFSQSGRTFARRLLAAEKARGLTQKGDSGVVVENPETFGLATGKGKNESRLANFQPNLPGMSLPPESFR
jgi:hypothetical protein